MPEAPRPQRPRPVAPDAATHAALSALLGDAPLRREDLLACLHAIQDSRGHLPRELLAALAERLRLGVAEVYEVASFYHHFDIVAAGAATPPALTVRVCDSLSCAMAGAETLLAELPAMLSDTVRIQRVPCIGQCAEAPAAVVGRRPIVAASSADIAAAIKAGSFEAPLPAAQSLADYRAAGGYQRYAACLGGQYRPDAVIAEIEASGLRGLGGAGFPTGRKWRIVAAAPAPRLLVVNLDEGEPGTFKDRHYLEREPHRFLEGVLIAAWAVDAERIWLYLRDEYAGCRRLLERELASLRHEWPQAPPITLCRGAGAYVCGEESAMLESIEGRRGMPRLRPPYVAQTGLFGRPTLINNLETLYWVPAILEHGAAWYAGHGRRGRSGLRSFSVSGRVARPGVYLAPAGISLRELVSEYCGGMATGEQLYGYLPGGASGGILPASLADLPLDFDTLAPYGCFLGSAAIVVLGERDSARAAALNATRFLAHESCGRCTPCRVGTAKAATLMAGERWPQELLEDLAQTMADASICGLGQAAGNPLRSVIRFFPNELA